MAVEFIDSIFTIDSLAWNSLCPAEYPFIRHEFFAALEESGSTGLNSGWQPKHLLLFQDDILIGALPLFIKHHSYGEYVFDWSWADAYHRHGYQYYPKLVSAIPFSPCFGPRLLLRAQLKAEDYLPEILASINTLMIELNASSWHCLFPLPEFSEMLASAGAAARIGCQFHWMNRHYLDFDDFLARLTSRKRKNIIKERRQVIDQGFEFVVKEGADITIEDWDFFTRVYQLTYLKRSGHTGYLRENFFHLLGKYLPQNTVLIIALHQQRPVAASLYFQDHETLYGRYWGCMEEFNFLHFETCYYQGIDYAIAQKLKRFDGGAQGEHKIQRGFEPIKTWSNHLIQEPSFRQAINTFLASEKPEIDAYIEDATQLLPFKSDS